MTFILGLLGGLTSLLSSWWMAFILVLPVVAAIFGEFLKPIARAVGTALEWLIDAWKEGLKDIFDTWQTIVTVLSMFAIVWTLGMFSVFDINKCPDVSPDLRIEYKLVPRTPAEKSAYLKQIGQEPWFWQKWF